jgi:hypothetical protein
MAASSLAMRRLFSHRVGVSRVVQQLTLKTVAQGGVARWHSTIPANGATIDASEAPSTRTVPQLKQVKSLPFVGSVLPFYSDVPSTIEQPYEFWPEMRRRHGDFYSMGYVANTVFVHCIVCMPLHVLCTNVKLSNYLPSAWTL